MNLRIKNFLLILPALFISLHVSGQSNYLLASDAEFIVAGTSSLHDWTMTSQSAKGDAIINIENKELKGIEELTITLKAETLKSGKSGMDDNAYKALNTKKHPNISFKLKQVKSIVKKGNQYYVDAEGTLSVAGESQTMDVQALADPTANTIKFIGSKTFKMTDFKIDPPTALLGTIKTGDEITITFNLTFKNR